jgi:adenine deaminase
VLEYIYLEGSPIAGSSTFTVSEVTDAAVLARHGVQHAARMQQVFEYQERDGSIASFFSRGGLRLHNQVVFSQAEQSAAAAGGRVLESNIPVEYRAW